MRIGFRITGLGDAWMRLIAIAVLSDLRPGNRHVVYPPAAVVPLARLLFSDRVVIEYEGDADVEMTHLGLRHILPSALLGKSYYLPFYWLQKFRRPKTTPKDYLNDLAHHISIEANLIQVPKRQNTFYYQGFMEMQGLIPSFRDVEWGEFEIKAPSVVEALGSRLRGYFTNETLKHTRQDVVFPSGTAHQIMPPDFARDYFTEAIFCFHRKDVLANDYVAYGLEVAYYDKPEDIIAHLFSAHRIYCTDSFPSHLAQVWEKGCYLLMTQQLSEMVVVPGFPRQRVIHSLARCHPCRSRSRRDENSVCDAGVVYCNTWSDKSYIAKIIGTMKGQK